MAKNKDKLPPDYLVGIDFGACNVKVVAKRDEQYYCLKINKKDDGGNECPNFIYYRKMKNGEIDRVFGHDARKWALTDHANAISRIKRKLELEKWQCVVPNLEKEITAVDAAADIFGALRNLLPLARGQEVAAVLTVPVGFSGVQTGRLRRAAEAAGIKVKGFVSESFAALFALRDIDPAGLQLNFPEQYKLIVVFDFGGSTLDVSIVKVENADDILEVAELVSGGLRLGGLDIDEAIYDSLIMPGHGEEIARHLNQNGDTARKLMLLDVEKGKEDLFSGNEDMVDISYNPPIALRREDVLNLLDSDKFRGKILAFLDSLFEQLEEGPDGFTRADVTKVLPFGGTSRLPFFIEMLEKYFDMEIGFDPDYTDLYVDDIEDSYMAVAGGAARYLDFVKNWGGNIKIVNVAPFQLGYMKNGEFVMCVGRNRPAGYESGYKPLPLKMLDGCGWRLSICQSFPGGEHDGPVYIGEVAIDKKKYSPGEAPLLKMRMSSDGALRVRVFQRAPLPEDNDDDCDDGINLVEEFALKLDWGLNNAG